RELIINGLSKSELRERKFSNYIIDRHFDITTARMNKSNIDKEILIQEIREKMYPLQIKW
ncbi:MAG: hypothetical protein WBA22_17830, partial [Candidatus Methanofastidiosia archaeon]